MARKPEKRIRIRSKRLEEIDDTKLALAVWLMAKGIVEDRTSRTDDAGGGEADTHTSGARP